MMFPVLEVRNLTKVFKIGSLFSKVKIVAVNDVSFDIKPGEIFALVGESGSGKTTIAKVILGFEEPTSGTILLKGKPLKSYQRKELLREVQAVFQNPYETFNPLKKVERYLVKTAKNFGLDRKNIETTLELVGLDLKKVTGKYPFEFSGGELQRISIARAMMVRPSLLIADEPVSMIDASLRMSIINLFKFFSNSFKMSILYITHDLATAYYISNRVAVMLRGEIVEMGPVEEVLQEPLHPYTRLLISSIPQPDPIKTWEGEVDISQERVEYSLAGCKFAKRCPEVREICLSLSPYSIVLNDRIVKCFAYLSFRERGST